MHGYHYLINVPSFITCFATRLSLLSFVLFDRHFNSLYDLKKKKKKNIRIYTIHVIRLLVDQIFVWIHIVMSFDSHSQYWCSGHKYKLLEILLSWYHSPYYLVSHVAVNLAGVGFKNRFYWALLTALEGMLLFPIWN